MLDVSKMNKLRKFSMISVKIKYKNVTKGILGIWRAVRCLRSQKGFLIIDDQGAMTSRKELGRVKKIKLGKF